MIEQLLMWGGQAETPFAPPIVEPGNAFKGFVSSDDLIDGNSLASLVSLSSGTAINNKAGWLKFVDGSKTLYIARKPLRYGTTVAAYKAASLLAGKTVNILGDNYKVRLMSGMSIDPFSSIIANGGGGEWEQYLYPIFKAPDRPSAAVWSYYTANDLGLLLEPNLNNIPRGVITVCKDQHNTISTAIAARGYDYSGNLSLNPIARRTVINDANINEGNGVNSLNVYGWRPVLELIGAAPPATEFLGEVAEADFITVAAFTALVGMGSIGSVTNANTTWLKFKYLGKTVYMPKKPLRHAMTWESMDALGITKGTTQFMINGKAHTVRLPTGSSSEPAAYGGIATGGSFNDLIYPIYGGVSLNQPEIQAYPRLAAYTDADLQLSTSKTQVAGAGMMSWCQELVVGGGNRLVRGYNDADNSGTRQLLAGWFIAFNATQTYAGWRPIIEEV